MDRCHYSSSRAGADPGIFYWGGGGGGGGPDHRRDLMSVLCKSTLHNTLITWAWDACALGFWLMSLTLVIMSIRVYDPSLTPQYPQRLRFSPGTLFWDSFTNHNTGNYSRHCIDITTNQRFSPIFRIFSEGGGGRGSVHRWSWWAEQN